jgi:hypothetical protein
MSVSPHAAATPHLPPFITAPGDTDVLLTAMAVFLVAGLLVLGVLLLRLHTLPERIAHKSQKLQFEIVAILGLLALFTHNHAFWVAGLLLAFIELPDFGDPLRRAAASLERIAAAAANKNDERDVAQPLRQIAGSLQQIAGQKDGDILATPLLPISGSFEAPIAAPTKTDGVPSVSRAEG